MPEPHNPTTYAEAGVNLDLGDAASQLLYRAARHTWEQRQGRFGEVIIPHDDFSGVRCIAVGMLSVAMPSHAWRRSRTRGSSRGRGGSVGGGGGGGLLTPHTPRPA